MDYTKYKNIGTPPKELDYPTGSILHDVRYVYKPEKFEVIYFDPITNKLEVNYEDPIIDLWFVKPEYRTNTYIDKYYDHKTDTVITRNKDKLYHYQMPQIEADKCYVVWCKPSQVAKMISIHAGDIPLPPDMNLDLTFKEYYDQNKDYNFKMLKSVMCRNPYCFKGDFTPDVYFRLRWLKQYGEDIDLSKVTYAFVDIETDVIDDTIDMQDYTSYGKQPINAVTIILPHEKICAVLILAPRSKNDIAPRFHQLLEEQQKEYDWIYNNQEEYKRMIVEDDEDNHKYLEGYEIRLHFFEFRHEIHLIKTIYDYINKYRPFFTYAWNAPFDFNYIPARISWLGYDPFELIIPQEFQSQTIRFEPDKSKNYSMKTAKDSFFVSTHTVWICQLRNYAAIRKSASEKRSYSLSAIGKSEVGIDKLTQTKSGTFREFAYTDFMKFIFYNIRDVVLQLAIEMTCNDSQSLLSRSYTFTTQYSKCFQETHIVRNNRESEYEEQGFIQACRLDTYSEFDKSFKGAFVAEPALNDFLGFILNNMEMNNMVYGVFDDDAKAYYPSSKMLTNQDGNSLLYKAHINNNHFRLKNCTNRSFNQEYIWYDSNNDPHEEDMSGNILNSYRQHNECSTLYNWFNLPSLSDYFKYIDMMINQ